jgi:NAD(P)-dependent dehydrogenase (short-subunit alcohol dehydrogenase family)
MLAERGVRVIIPCRNLEKGMLVKQKINSQNIKIFSLDLLSLKSVHAFVQMLKERGTQIDFLINNAGAMFADPLPTEDGIERTLATNYTSVFALTTGLLPLMAQNSIIVNTLSVMVHTTKIDKSIFEIPTEKKYGRLKQYSRSKAALMYFTSELTRRLAADGAGNMADAGSTVDADNANITAAANKNITVCATDPGVVNTGIITMHKWYDPLADIFARPFFKTPQTAAQITMRAIADRQNNFLYKGKSQKRPLPPLDKDFSNWLWNKTAEKTINCNTKQ